ncbi:MAG: bifunctional riboflavin kinase/FAD synthetase [Bacteroidota bacterium]
MKVYRALEAYEKGKKTVATIGTFDGLHLGHRTILDRLRSRATEIGGETVLISFHPHPRLVLFPDNNPLRLLHTLEEKIAMLEEIGIDKLLLIPFTREFSRMSSNVFIRDILVQTVGIHHLCIGYDHHFGKNRTGGIEELREYEPRYIQTVEEIPAQTIDDANISSTKIRNALLSGDVQMAQKYLGYQYSLAGEVVHGAKQGRQFGYPTANLKLDDPLKLIPTDGVYFVEADIRGKTYFGMMSIGKKPTLGEHERALEVYLFDFSGDIYGDKVRVNFLEFLRPQQKFDSIDTLIKAIDGDRDRCLKLIAERKA